MTTLEGVMDTEYYVYGLKDPRDDKIFYIGQGKGNRAYKHALFQSGVNNPHKDRIINKIHALGLEVIVVFLETNLSKSEAILLEQQKILEIGIENLSNICLDANPPIYSGKQNGFYGKTHTAENKKKMEGCLTKGVGGVLKLIKFCRQI